MDQKKRILKKETIPILLVLCIALVIRVAVMVGYGVEYNLDSDDVSYVNAAIRFCETGEITMHGVISAQIMPGMIWLLAPLVFIFGTGKKLWLAMKLVWLAMSICSIYGVYRIVKLYAKTCWAILAAAFFFAIDFAWMDNLILTETPFMLAFIYLIYASLKLAETQKSRYFWYICFWYMFGLLLKATIAPVPLFLFLYLWLKNYDMKLMAKQMGVAIVIVLLFIVPWSIRNYIRFDHFVPLTYGAGNPRLLGSYQGEMAPADEELDYQTNVYDKMPEEMRKYYNADGTLRTECQGEVWYKDYMAKYYSLELDGMKADYRLAEWKKNAPLDYVKSILIEKPRIMIYGSFYWDELFGIPIEANYWFRRVDLYLFVIGFIGILLNKQRRKESLFILSVYVFQIAVYSFTFAFSRYGQTLYFLRYIIIGWGLHELISYLRSRYGNRADGAAV